MRAALPVGAAARTDLYYGAGYWSRPTLHGQLINCIPQHNQSKMRLSVLLQLLIAAWCTIAAAGQNLSSWLNGQDQLTQAQAELVKGELELSLLRGAAGVMHMCITTACHHLLQACGS